MNSTNNIWDFIKNSITIKLFIIFILILLLLIPNGFISRLIYERESAQTNAKAEVNEKWGADQLVSGPIISIPYKMDAISNQGVKITTEHLAHFLPQSLKIDASIDPEIRRRGIYEIPLYKSVLKINGVLTKPDFEALKIDPARVLWDKAIIYVGIKDVKGLTELVTLKTGTESLNLGSGIPAGMLYASGLNTPLPKGFFDGVNEKSFEILLHLNGSERLNFEPIGSQTEVNMQSSWKDPKFSGNFITTTNEINETGFKASWKILSLNRNYPQQWADTSYAIGGSDFGVDLFMPVDEYVKTSRSVQYAIMFIFLTFLVFLFTELMQKRRIHPIQYLMVGSALCLFYLLELSLSEHLPFNTAYIIAAAAIIILISGYTWLITKQTRITMILGSLLVALYGFLYTLLIQEDYALLVGSIGLFIILAAIMYISRNIRWYADPANE